MIRIIQLLCPQRHCIIAVAYETATQSPDASAKALEQGLNQIKPNPWCAICGSHKLRVEDRPSRFTTLEEACAAMKARRADQVATRSLLDRQGLTHDQRRNN